MLAKAFCLLIILFTTPSFAENNQKSSSTSPETVKAIVPIYNQKIGFQLPSDWKLAFRNQNASHFMMEFIPKNETLENWTNMFTISAIKGASNTLPLPQLIQDKIKSHEAACGKQAFFRNIGHTHIDGYQTLQTVIGCGSITDTRPEPSAESMSELAYFIAIKGDKDVYLIHKSRRGDVFDVSAPPVTSKNIKEFISEFIPIEVCKALGQQYECLK